MSDNNDDNGYVRHHWQARYGDRVLVVTSDCPCNCDEPGDNLHAVTNADFPDDDTGFWMCERCGGLGYDPDDRAWMPVVDT